MARYQQERRKQLIVNKSLQGRLIANMALLPAIALAGIAVFTGIYVHGLMDEAIATDTELPDLMPLFYLVIVFELLAAVFLMANSLKVSHLVAGPAYRLVKSLERIRTGDASFKVTLRRGDLLTEVCDELNLLIDWLNENPPPGCLTRRQAAVKALENEAAADAEKVEEAAKAAAAAAAAVEAAAGVPADQDRDAADAGEVAKAANVASEAETPSEATPDKS